MRASPPDQVSKPSSRRLGLILASCLCLVLSGCGVFGDSGERDPLLWPFPSDSIWNYPRGDDARLIPFPVEATDLTVMAEEDLLVAAPEATTKDVMSTTAGWSRDLTRCGEVTDEVLIDDLPIPDGWSTDPDYTGRTPNHAAAIVLPDYTLVETQPLHVCADGTPVSQYASEKWRGSSLLSGAVPGDPGAGSHGGSGMTAFGGTIRTGEWVPGGEIRHAMKITVQGDELSSTDEGYRWPAYKSDRDSAYTYTGSVPQARMGALVTLPGDFDVDDLDSEPARIFARALIDYGAYIVDDAGQSTVGIAVEWGPQGRVSEEFEDEWGYELVGRAQYAVDERGEFLDDMERIYASFAIVDDNAADQVGGAGDRLAPMAPPLATVDAEAG